MLLLFYNLGLIRATAPALARGSTEEPDPKPTSIPPETRNEEMQLN